MHVITSIKLYTTHLKKKKKKTQNHRHIHDKRTTFCGGTHILWHPVKSVRFQHWTAPQIPHNTIGLSASASEAAAHTSNHILCYQLFTRIFTCVCLCPCFFCFFCRILLTVVVIFRILIVAIVGETVYDDEQTMFVCNTLQPGCNQACYDKAFPISHIRYWVFQIIMVCTPSLCFITYSVHQSAKQKERRYSTVYLTLDKDQDSLKRDESKKIKNTIVNGVLQNTENSTKEAEPDCLEVKEIPNSAMRTTKSKMRRQEGISRFYIIQVVFRNALEIGFLVGQYFLYGFNVPSVYECDRYPCIKDVECYVSRPTEKTVFLVFMFAVSGFCVVLNLAELNHLGWRKIKTAVRGVQARRKSIYEIRNKDLPRMSVPNFGRTQSSDSAYV
ncbi:gap junction delta-2 protein [Solea senegalensis]|nr:gap junction protein delta 2b isoform X1 [Solea senegalensis]KAG7511269.1 gap junction delta-2 protein [Solea senegalensis]